MPRNVLLGPVAFVLIGIAAGVSADIFLYYGPGLTVSTLLAAVGASFGIFIGWVFHWIMEKRPKTQPAFTVIATTLLAGCVGAPVAWIIGGAQVHFPYRPVSRVGMIWGACVGIGVGIALGAFQVYSDRRKSAGTNQLAARTSGH